MRNKWFQLSGSISQQETKSVFFNRDFCDVLINQLRATDVDGLRVYFGSYEKDHPNPNRTGKMTLIFVTTKNGEVNDLESPDDAEMGPQDYEGRGIEIKEELNDGALCPPLGCNTDPENELWPTQ